MGGGRLSFQHLISVLLNRCVNNYPNTFVSSHSEIIFDNDEVQIKPVYSVLHLPSHFHSDGTDAFLLYVRALSVCFCTRSVSLLPALS